MLARSIAALGGASDLAGLDPERTLVVGQLMTFEGWFRLRQGRYVPACDLLEQTVALLRPLGNKSALADALASQGMALNLMGEYRQARRALLEHGPRAGRPGRNGGGARRSAGGDAAFSRCLAAGE